MLNDSSTNIGLKASRLLFKNQSGVLNTILNFIPTPIAIWSDDRSWGILNSAAMHLTGFSRRDFHLSPTLWMEHVHPQDRVALSAAWETLKGGKKNVSCKYRFFPKKSEDEIWLRDVSASRSVLGEETSVVCSAYTQLSSIDACEQSSSEQAQAPHPTKNIIRQLTHAIQNNLQAIIGQLEILNFPVTAPSGYPAILSKVSEIDGFLRQLNEYFFPATSPFAVVDPLVVLKDLQREVGKNLADHGICVAMVCKDTLPDVMVDPKSFRNAVRQVINFSLVLLPNGGEVLIDARQKTVRGSEFVELSVTLTSEGSLAFNEEDVFQPFVRVNDQCVGLSMAITQEILRRQQGEVIFRRENRQRGVFTVLIKVCAH